MRALTLLPLLALVACAHADVRPSPIVVTGHTLDVAGATFEAVAAGMLAASDRGAVTRDQALAWNDFLARWKAGYPAAVEAWKDAKRKLDEPAASQAAGIIGGLIGELAVWQYVILGGPR